MQKAADPKLRSADIEWRDGVPVSRQFDDVYYSRDNGLEETGYVFLQHNRLAERWAALDSDGGHFSIGETGFGSGLNFLAAADLWLRTAPGNWQLHFVSAELFPMSNQDLHNALACWPELKTLADQLCAQYPATVPGVHRLSLAGDRIQLTLLFGEAAEMLAALSPTADSAPLAHPATQIDAWFLDGFAPAKNPQMWSDSLFASIARLSTEGTTFATFTAAGVVRRGLAASGFNVAKVKGYGNKREMLCGTFGIPEQSVPVSELRWYINDQPRSKHKEVVVLGAGIAGCTTAVALRKRGFRVTVIDRHSTAGQEGSGNPQGIVYPKLSARNDYLPRINLAALQFAQRYYQPYWQRGFGAQCGVLVLPENDSALNDFSAIAERFADNPELVQQLTGTALHDVSGLPLASGQGLWFPQLGWLPPRQICQQMLEDHQIPLISARIAELQPSESGWQLTDASRQVIAQSEIVVIAAANGVPEFTQTTRLPLRRIRGQISLLPANEQSNALRVVLCGSGYLTPASDSNHSCGATYNRDNPSSQLNPADHHINLRQLAESDGALASLWPDLQVYELQGRANFRCTTPDYLPLVGPVADITSMLTQFDFLQRDARQVSDQCGSYHRNLYLHCGLGSRGLSYAPLMAELLAAQICGEIPPLERELCQALSPARFVIRDLKRNRLDAYKSY